MEIYFCELCKYSTTKSSNYSRHCLSKKHITNVNKTKYICEYCNKEYLKLNSLWYHKKKCKIQYDKFKEQSNNNIEIQNHTEILKLKQQLNDEISKLNEKIDNVKPNVFNLNFFLYEQCKNAMTIDKFLSELQIDFDLNNSLEKDAIDGLKKALTDMNVYERPFHCLDLKRNKICIKDNDTWTNDPNIFEKVPKKITKLYNEEINKWEERNEDYLGNEEKLSIFVLHNAKHMQVMNHLKILRTVLKSTLIPKPDHI